MKINRRDFVKFAGSLFIIPEIKLEPSPLRFKRIEADFDISRIEISKGPYKTTVNSCIDSLRDSHGLCATDELASIVIEDIEFGVENLKKLWNRSFSMNSYETKQMKNSLRRIRLSKQERMRIRYYLSSIRGPHCCVYDSPPRSISPFWDRKLNENA